jgi:molybdopterin-synthase adenylyltransferase
MIEYSQLVLRNRGYISDSLQDKIRRTRVLVAGCGIGSTIAEAAVRTGFVDILLVDGDRVDAHNLNRQCYVADDVGQAKATSLARRLQAINPSARIDARAEWIAPQNADRIVEGIDVVFDTVDFLDLSAIVALHDAAHARRLHVISAVSAGFGAALMYFPPDGELTFREAFGCPRFGPVDGLSYVERFSGLLAQLRPALSPAVVHAMKQALTVMEDGTPCPAPHLAVGAECVASLAVTVALRVLAGEPVAAVPDLILTDMETACRQGAIRLKTEPAEGVLAAAG